MEKKIVNNLIKKIVKAGFSVNIDNGGDCYELPKPTNRLKTIQKEIGATGHDNLILFKDDVYFGFVTLIYGNGEDVISDYSTNLDHLIVWFIFVQAKGGDNLAFLFV